MNFEQSTDLRYKHHLTGVSRSFAFCIEELRGDFRHQVSLAYLLLRVLDTLEDSPWGHVEQKIKALVCFKQEIVKNEITVSEGWKTVQQEIQLLSISSAEKSLLQSSDLLFRDFKNLPLDIRNILKDTILTMTAGMAEFNQKSQLVLNNIFDLDRYCFFVAGIVGELLERLHRHEEEAPSNLYRSVHFGLFLQKVNILKDQLQDEKLGRFFVFDRNAVVDSIGVHAEQAMQYIHSLDLKEKGYRLFCAWSLFLGLLTLQYSDRGFKQGQTQKVPRWKAKLLILLVRSIISSPSLLQWVFQNLFRKVLTSPSKASTLKNANNTFIQASLYQGRLRSSDWRKLGLE